MDVAASEFHKDGKYDLDFKNPNSNPADWISSEKLCEMYQGFIKDAPVISIEDPFDQVGDYRNLSHPRLVSARFLAGPFWLLVILSGIYNTFIKPLHLVYTETFAIDCHTHIEANESLKY